LNEPPSSSISSHPSSSHPIAIAINHHQLSLESVNIDRSDELKYEKNEDDKLRTIRHDSFGAGSSDHPGISSCLDLNWRNKESLLVFENTIMFLSKATHSAHSPKKHIV
jgi:hypothetical protein